MEGNELLLYFLISGDNCALTLSCCLGRTRREIRAVVDKDTNINNGSYREDGGMDGEIQNMLELCL